ncbi:unnamed protein product [Calypogeia fissa]
MNQQAFPRGTRALDTRKSCLSGRRAYQRYAGRRRRPPVRIGRISGKSPVSRLQDSPLQNSDSPQVASEILSEELINGEDGEEESRGKRFKGAGKEDEVITYKRRSRIRRETEKAVKGDELYNYERKSPACGSKRKHPDDRELENCENVSDWETDRTDTIDQTTLS